MRLIVNGEPREGDVPDLAALFAREVEDRGIGGPDGVADGVAMALNGRVVRRAEWAATPLNEGDCVEIVRAMQGG